MTIHLSIILWLPLVATVLGLLTGPGARWLAILGGLLTFVYTIILIADFDRSLPGLQYVTDDTWIAELGIHYKLGVDGLNLFLIGLTAFIFLAAFVWIAFSHYERVGQLLLFMGLAESAVLGALMAQDLALFVLFFDLMLVPFYFLTGIWGGENRIPAITKLFIYTLVGSLLMLVAAIATGVLAANQGDGDLTFVLSDLARTTLPEGSQQWIFLCFAAAFLVKMPAFPLHGWMPDGYRNMPLPVLMVFSAVLSKVAAYGFLRVVTPLFPDASVHFQELMLLIALASILYGSAMAFTTTEARLVLGYSSVAQLGFIVLGIFSLQGDGAQGAIFQAVNHGLVVAPAFVVVGALALRARGSEDLRDMGGIAFRAPVLATLFLIVTFATLAMPGSANFVGEFLILLGVFNSKIVIAIVAFTGVALASVYALRLFIRAVHNRVGPEVQSREISLREGLVLVPLVAVVLFFAVYPQLALHKAERTVTESVRSAAQIANPSDQATRPEDTPVITLLAQAKPAAPDIDWAALSPLIALLGGSLVVLFAGLFRSRAVREHGVPFLTLVAFGGAIGLSAWQWNTNVDLFVGGGSVGALRMDDLALLITAIVCVTGMATTLLSWRAQAPREAAHGEYFALMLTSAAGMVVFAAAQNLVTLFLGLELLSIPLYVLCATEMRRAKSLESGLKYLIVGSVGSATFLYGLAMLYGATGQTDFPAIAAAISSGINGDVLLLTGIALSVVGLGFKASVAPFHQWTPDVYEGAPTPVTAFMAVATKAAAFGAMIRLFDVALIDAQPDWGPLLAALATVTIIVGNVGALGQSSLKRLLAWSSVAQAGYLLAGVVVASRLGVQATVFYLITYLFMNIAAFAVIVARERETNLGDSIDAVAGIGTRRPLLAWPLTLAMLSLAGLPVTAGFIGKFELIRATADGGYTWLGIVIVIGSMISLAYYLRVIAAVWMRPAPAPGTDVAPTATPRSALQGADPAAERSDWEVTAVAVLAGAAVLVFGIIPSPLLNLAVDAGRSLGLL